MEDGAGTMQRIAGEQQALDMLAVAGPLLDLVEIAMVGDQGLVSLFVGLGHDPMQLDLAMEKECRMIFGSKSSALKPCQTRLCCHFRQVSCLGRQANVKQGLVKRSLRDQKKTCPDSRGASTTSVGLRSLKTLRTTVTRCSRIL